jgi:hypothetical protein
VSHLAQHLIARQVVELTGQFTADGRQGAHDRFHHLGEGQLVRRSHQPVAPVGAALTVHDPHGADR